MIPKANRDLTGKPRELAEAHLVLSIDPGLRACGAALWTGKGTLITAAFIKNTVKTARGPEAWTGMARAMLAWVRDSEDAVYDVVQPDAQPRIGTVLIEQQRIQYGRTKNPADIIELTGTAGAVSGALATMVFEVQGYFDTEWKGSVPKEAMTKRIEARIRSSPKELMRVVECAPSLIHNLWDAVGIGLFYFDRLAPKRVIAR